jgi:uncharacterized protein (DUF305 family)
MAGPWQRRENDRSHGPSASSRVLRDNVRTTLTIRPISGLSLLLLLPLAGCRTGGAGPGPAIVQPGAPGEPSKVIGVDRATDVSKISFTPADVRFMQGMIGHHAQALEMTEIIRARSGNEAIRALALRIEVSQADEIKMMQGWLAARRQPLPDPHAHHASGTTLMPGMLTREQMARLSEASGPELDRLFLELMIKHHEGALVMVKDLLATPGAGQEADVFAFASDVEADQQMEIDRMRAALGASKES